MDFREEEEPGSPGVPERDPPTDPDFEDKPTIFPFVERNQRPKRRQLSQDAELVKLLRELQVEIQNRARVGAGVVGFRQLQAQGMQGVPSFQNGGVQWMLQLLSDPLIRGLFFSPQGQRPENFAPEVGPTIAAFEESTAQASRQVSQQLPQDNGAHFFEGMIGQLVTATAAAGGAASVAFGGKEVAKRIGRFRPGPTTVSGRGAGGFTFKAPTFRPGFAQKVGRRRPKFSFSGQPPSE